MGIWHARHWGVKGAEIFIIGVPAYYNFDIVRMKLKNIMQQYTGINTITPWISVEPGSFATILNIENTQILILYNVQYNRHLAVSKFKSVPDESP